MRYHIEKRGADGRFIKDEALVQFGKEILLNLKKELWFKAVDGLTIEKCLDSSEPEKAFVYIIPIAKGIVEPLFKEYFTSPFYEKMKYSAGPFGELEMVGLLEKGEITGQTLVWNDGSKPADWIEAKNVSSFEDVVNKTERISSLTESEMEQFYHVITLSKASLAIVTEGMQVHSAIIRSLCLRLLFLLIRATMMGLNSASQLTIGKYMTEFVQNVRANAGVLPIKQVMDDHFSYMVIMFNPCSKLAADFDGKETLQPGREICNAALWMPMCYNLYGSNVFPRTKCLEDIYYRVLTHKRTAASFLQLPHWQTWILPLTFDIAPSESASLTKLMQYVVGMVSRLLWTILVTKDFEDFVREIRFTAATTMAVCADSSGSVFHQIMSSILSRFHTESPNWIKLPASEQYKYYKSFQHVMRLVISLGLNVSGTRFGTYDPMRTSKILPKELQEKHIKKIEMKEEEEEQFIDEHPKSTQKDSIDRPNQGFDIRVHTKSRPSGSSHTQSRPSRSEDSISQTPRTFAGKPQTVRLDICTDQELIYIQRVYQFCMSGSNDEVKRFISSACLPNAEISNLKLENMRFILNGTEIMGFYNDRLKEMKLSIEKYGESNFICNDAVLPAHVRIKAYGLRWREDLHEFILHLAKIESILIDIQYQDEKLVANGNQSYNIDNRCKKMRAALYKQIHFLNDVQAFMSLMHSELWELLEPEQTRALSHKFAELKDSNKRRKIFNGWEKEKVRNEAKRLKRMEKQLEIQLKGKTAAKLLIDPGGKRNKINSKLNRRAVAIG